MDKASCKVDQKNTELFQDITLPSPSGKRTRKY